MKLELFDFIDQTLALIEKDADKLNKVAEELENFFNNSLFIKDHFLNVNYRIKSSESLKESIWVDISTQYLSDSIILIIPSICPLAVFSFLKATSFSVFI